MATNILEIITKNLTKNKINFKVSEDNNTVIVGFVKDNNLIKIFFQISEDKIDSLAIFLPKEDQLINLSQICNTFNATHFSKLFYQKFDDKYYLCSELTYYIDMMDSKSLDKLTTRTLTAHLDAWRNIRENEEN